MKRFANLTAMATLAVAAVAAPPKPPAMGWSSWNNFRVNINDSIICAQADAMAANGMKDAGYTYINIDDGYFGGRDAEANLITHPTRFPNGLRATVDHIHSLGLKAGIYTDAGIITCGSISDGDKISVGSGLYGHDYQDIDRFLRQWDFDFLKIDWCGGATLGLDLQTRYSLISDVMRSVKPDAIMNVCCWGFPGDWVSRIADSWRIYGDIEPNYNSICTIIDHNADLWRKCEPGHYNDMDMLQVGRGMTLDEDRTHFTMWCMMASPLIAGNDLANMNPEILAILTNPDMIAINQDPGCYQARRLSAADGLELWARPLGHTMSGRVAVALHNRTEEAQPISFDLKQVGIKAEKGYNMRNVWADTDAAGLTDEQQTFLVPKHGVVVLLLDGTMLPDNVFQRG